MQGMTKVLAGIGLVCMAATGALGGSPPFEEIWEAAGSIAPDYNRNTHLFGHAVALSGQRLAVGRPGVQIGGAVNAGKVHIYTLDNNGRTNTGPRVLEPSSAANDVLSGAFFGAAVDLKGTQCIVGAPGNVRMTTAAQDNQNVYAGAVYLYEGANWQRTARLRPSANAPRTSKFGASVGVDGEFAVVGSPGESSVYFYRKVNGAWNQVAKVTKAGFRFGTSVAISGTRILAGAPEEEAGRGCVYAYQWANNQWQQAQRIRGVVAGGRFGHSVAMDGLRAVVGSIAENTYRGAARVYEFSQNQWQWKARLASEIDADYQAFGDSVDVSGSKIVVGSLADPWDDPTTGEIYVYGLAYNAWNVLYYKHLPWQNGEYASYIHDVAIDGNLAAGSEAIDAAYGDNERNLGRVDVLKFDHHEVFFENLREATYSLYTPGSVRQGTAVLFSIEITWDARVPAADRVLWVQLWDVRGMTSIYQNSFSAGAQLVATGSGTSSALAGNMPVRFRVWPARALPAGVPGPTVILHAQYTLQ